MDIRWLIAGSGVVALGVVQDLLKDASKSILKALWRKVRRPARQPEIPAPAESLIDSQRVREEAAIARMNVERSNRLLKALIKGLEETGAFIPETVVDLKDQRRGFRARVSQLAPADSEHLSANVEEWYDEILKTLEESTQLEVGIRMAWTKLPRDQWSELPGKDHLPQFRSLLAQGEQLFRDAIRIWR